jgi:RNA polymerase sigma-70 factor (ECF subfamily)
MNPDPQDHRLEAMYRAYAHQVHGYCIRRTGREEAKDATAEVFLVAWRRLDGIPEGDEALPWLYGVARNVLSNQARTSRRQTRLSAKAAAQFEETVPGPDTVVVRNEEYERLLVALGALPAKDQEILRLVEWEGVHRETVADMMFISRSAVDKRMNRAYKKLAASMGLPKRDLLTTPLTIEEGREA